MNKKILDVIVDALTGESINWTRKWNTVKAHNYTTNTPYKGANVYLNYIGESFLTFSQIKKLKGSLKKWSKSYPIVYAMFAEQKGEEKAKFIWHRYFRVFNINDVTGLEKSDKETPIREEPSEVLQNYIKREELEIIREDPCYNSSKDCIGMPNKERFQDIESYNATLAHECTHSTGHEKRTNRHNAKATYADHVFGSQGYAKEELVAELGAVILTWNTVSTQ